MMWQWGLIACGGLLGSSHCVGMCGGFAMMIGLHRNGAAKPDRTTRFQRRSHCELCHAGGRCRFCRSNTHSKGPRVRQCSGSVELAGRALSAVGRVSRDGITRTADRGGGGGRLHVWFAVLHAVETSGLTQCPLCGHFYRAVTMRPGVCLRVIGGKFGRFAARDVDDDCIRCGHGSLDGPDWTRSDAAQRHRTATIVESRRMVGRVDRNVDRLPRSLVSLRRGSAASRTLPVLQDSSGNIAVDSLTLNRDISS